MKQGITGALLLSAALSGGMCATVGYAAADVASADNNKSSAKRQWVEGVYVGAGLQNKFMHLSAEALTPYANVYGKVGALYAGDGLAAQVGFRRPYLLTGEGSDRDGYYFGGLIGHLDDVAYSVPFTVTDGTTTTTRYKSKRENRIGAAAELSYVWQNKQRLNVASVALGVAPSKTVGSGSNTVEANSSPMILFNYTFQVNVF